MIHNADGHIAVTLSSSSLPPAPQYSQFIHLNQDRGWNAVSSSGAHPSKRALHELQRIQRASRVNQRWGNQPYSESRRTLNLFSLTTRRLSGGLITLFKCLHREKISNSGGIFNLAKLDLGSSGWKLKRDKLRLVIRRKF